MQKEMPPAAGHGEDAYRCYVTVVYFMTENVVICEVYLPWCCIFVD